jgi:hypothetical protein
MNFYQNIQPFLDYLYSIRKLKDYLSVDLHFPNKWTIPKSVSDSTETVPFQSENPDFKGISFVCPSDEQSVSTTISKILKTITTNKEREIKEQLFRQTIDQLKKTFEQNDLEKLQNLYFDFATEIEDTSNLDSYDSGQSENINLA